MSNMKRLTLAATVALFAAVAAFAGPPVTQWYSVAVQTNAAASVTNAPYADPDVIGWADTVIVNISGAAAPTCTVSFVTMAGSESGAARVLLTVTISGTSGSYPIRDIVTTTAGVDIANTPARIPVWSRVRMLAYAGNVTNLTAKARLFVAEQP